jgi:S-formylglutathione hydrolase FrmB
VTRRLAMPRITRRLPMPRRPSLQLPLVSSGRAPALLASAGRSLVAPLVSVLVAVLILALAVGFGPVRISTDVLVGLGFDPDRADLITALIVGGLTAVVVYIAGGLRATAVVLGLAASSALFGPTFVRETRDAMVATGAVGAFSPMGWVQTVLAFIVVGLVTMWACATCAVPIRRELLVTASAMRTAVRQKSRDRQAWARPAAAAVIVCLLAVTLPMAGNMFDKGADNEMISGGPARQGLVPEEMGVPVDGGAVVDQASPSIPLASAIPSAPASAETSPSATPPPSPTPSLEPWKNSLPTGQGRVVYWKLPAPWEGSATSEVAVYMPPGYDTNPTKRYPVVYEAPFNFYLWNTGAHIKAALDTLITGGSIPPMMFVFMDAGNGPYPDSQCADSFDRLELMDTFLGVTVPTYIDGNYRTIARASARATMGMSQGGYCAAVLAMRHPSTFGAIVSFSGYFTAGSGTATAKLPFGGNANLIALGSPSWIASNTSVADRSGLYFVLVAQTGQAFYGPEATKFAAILDQAGYGYDLVDAADPHGWPQVRTEFERALVLLATNQAGRGVFD